jgi:hypothetical protein
MYHASVDKTFLFFAKFQITLVSVLMDMAVVPRLVEDDVDDPHRMIMLAKVHPIPSCASARGVSVKSGVREKEGHFRKQERSILASKGHPREP